MDKRIQVYYKYLNSTGSWNSSQYYTLPNPVKFVVSRLHLRVKLVKRESVTLGNRLFPVCSSIHIVVANRHI